MYRRILVSLAASAMLAQSVPWAAPAPPQQRAPATYQEARGQFDKYMSLLNQMRQHLDRSQFDPEALLDRLDYDAEAIVEFVMTEIAFEQYAGLLRGPSGTLIARAGNALDQAVLLAKLLKDAGLDARVARTTLSVELARELLAELQHKPPPVPPPGNLEALHPVVEEMARGAEGLGQAEAADLIRRALHTPHVESSAALPQVRAAAEFINLALRDSKLGVGGPDTIEALTEEARDYFWVQYRDGTANAWSAAHPIFHGHPPTGLEPVSVYTSEVPAELHHRIRFQVFLERKSGTRLTSIAITEPWERPVANVAWRPLTFTNFPDSLSSDRDFVDLTAAIERAELFLPLVGGRMAPGAQFFDLAGNVVDPMAGGSAAAGVVRSVGGSFGKAAGAIAESADQIPILSAQWMEFTLISPDGREQVFRRTLFDAIGTPDAAARAMTRPDPARIAQAAGRLVQQHTFMLGVGAMSPAFALDQILLRTLSTRPILAAVLQKSFDPATPVAISQGEFEAVMPEWWGHFLLFPGFDRARELFPDHRIYSPEPYLMIYTEGQPVDGRREAFIDIVNNTRRALSLGGGTFNSDPSALILAGVWETALESLVVPTGTEGRSSTFLAFETSGATPAPTVLSPGDQERLPELIGDPGARHHIRRDLDAGFAILLPASRLDPGTASAWWRVHLATGETLGMLSDGRGSEFTEALSLISGMISFAFWGAGMKSCVLETSNEAEFSCCVAVNTGFWIGGAIVGAFVSAAGVVSALGVFAGDLVYNMATARVSLCGR